MMAWLKSWLRERSTQICLPIFIACAALIWLYQAEVKTFVVGALAFIGSAISDNAYAYFSARLRLIFVPQPAAAPLALTMEHPMPNIDKLLADVPDFLKVAQDIASITETARTTGPFAAFPLMQAAVPDIEKCIADIKALGVKEAVASGTVVPVTV